MNEVEIPIKVTGLGAIKAELKALKGEIANATDPADIARLSQAAGALNDKLKDANESVKNFSTGSAFESSKNQINGIQDSLMSLDFEEAGQKMQGFAKNLATMDPSKVTAGLGAMTKGIGKLGGAFLKMGLQLLANPIFLLVVVIVAIVAAVAIFLNKIGVLQKVLDVLMIPINALIQGFKNLTDWMGLTSYAADENAERVAAANENIQASSQDRAKSTDSALAHEIRMAKIAGKDTTQLELQKSMVAQREAYIRIKANQKEILSKMHDTSKEGIAARKKLKDQIKAENDLIKAGVREREAIRAQSVVDANKPDKPVGGGGGGGSNDGAKNRLAAQRAFADFEISIIKDAGEREIATVNEKYKRMQEDLVKDKDKTKAEKERFTQIYLAQQKEELDLLAKNKTKTEADNLLAGENMIAELRLSMMEDGTEKEIAMTKSKYDKLRKAALDNITLTETQKAELTKIYNEQEVAENTKRTEAKIAADTKAQVDLLASLQAQEVIAQEARKAKLAKDLETANNDAATIKAINDKYQAESIKMENDAANAKVDAAQRERDAKLTLASDIGKGITDIGNMLIKDQAKAAKLNKAAALFQLGVDTAKAISALVAAANSNPLNGVTAGGAGIAQYVAGAIQIATNMAKAKQILSNPAGASGVGGGGGGGGGSSAGSNTATVVPQGPNLFGSANTGNTMSAGGVTDSSMTVTAIVSETQVTSVQNKINRINKSAEL
jgi:hypothetical protein